MADLMDFIEDDPQQLSEERAWRQAAEALHSQQEAYIRLLSSSHPTTPPELSHAHDAHADSLRASLSRERDLEAQILHLTADARRYRAACTALEQQLTHAKHSVQRQELELSLLRGEAGLCEESFFSLRSRYEVLKHFCARQGRREAEVNALMLRCAEAGGAPPLCAAEAKPKEEAKEDAGEKAEDQAVAPAVGPGDARKACRGGDENAPQQGAAPSARRSLNFPSLAESEARQPLSAREACRAREPFCPPVVVAPHAVEAPAVLSAAASSSASLRSGPSGRASALSSPRPASPCAHSTRKPSKPKVSHRPKIQIEPVERAATRHKAAPRCAPRPPLVQGARVPVTNKAHAKKAPFVP
ncbi:hypothetical protein AB1Y20_023503 [Prymnesium parvum]|uniref:Uncharacterized protein n=1 Tax=Prymnesium parvum TaxID=97485 RepID=A0AB34JEG3_PRYPA